MRLGVGTIIAGPHIDAAFRRAGLRRRRAIGLGPDGIEGGRIAGLQIDQREVDRSPRGMLGLLGDMVGGLSRSPESTTQALVLPQLILGMVSTGFAPASQFPSWIQGFARVQPVSQFVDVMRPLAGDRSGHVGAVTLSAMWPGLAWLLAAAHRGVGR